MMWVSLMRCFRRSEDLWRPVLKIPSLLRCVICRLLRSVEISSRRLRKSLDGGLDR